MLCVVIDGYLRKLMRFLHIVTTISKEWPDNGNPYSSRATEYYREILQIFIALYCIVLYPKGGKANDKISNNQYDI